MKQVIQSITACLDSDSRQGIREAWNPCQNYHMLICNPMVTMSLHMYTSKAFVWSKYITNIFCCTQTTCSKVRNMNDLAYANLQCRGHNIIARVQQ